MNQNLKLLRLGDIVMTQGKLLHMVFFQAMEKFMLKRQFSVKLRNLVNKRHSYIFDIFLLFTLCLFFFWRILTPRAVDRWIFEPGDFAIVQYYPASYLTQRIDGGTFPLWQNYAYAGHPFIGDLQNTAFYPIRLLNVLLHINNPITYFSIEIEVFLHFLIIIWSCYLLARKLTGNRYGGLLTAITFTFSGYLTGYPPLQFNFLESQAWLPLILLSWEVAATNWRQNRVRSAWVWAVVAGLLWGMSILGGSAQSGLILFYGVLAFAVFRLWPRGRISRHNILALFGILTSYIVVGLGVAAIQLFPTVEMLRLSTRASIGFEEAGRGFMPYDLLQLLYPALGGQFQAIYVGILPLGLMTLTLLIVRHDPQTSDDNRSTIVFWGWSGLIALLLSFGKSISVFAIPYLLAPGWGLFRQQERTIVWAVLAVALLAGYGMTWLSQRWQGQGKIVHDSGDPHDEMIQRRLQSVYGIALTVVTVLALVFFVGYQAGKENFWGFTTASLMIALFLALAIIVLRTRNSVILVLFLIFDLFTFNTVNRFAGPHSENNIVLDNPAIRMILTEEAHNTNLFRVMNDDVLQPSYGALVGLEDITGGSPLTLQTYDQWQKRVSDDRALLFLNVKYVITRQETLSVPADRLWEGQDASGAFVYLYRVTRPNPRAWLAGSVIIEPDFEKALIQVAAPEFDPLSDVVVPAIPAGMQEGGRCAGTIAWQQRKPEFLSLEVVVDQPCLLVISELFYPGWRAEVNGATTTILQADGIFRAVALPGGSHHVTLAYRPRSVYVGAILTCSTLLLVLVLFIGARLAASNSSTLYRNHHGTGKSSL